jgi:hypothetical protein
MKCYVIVAAVSLWAFSALSAPVSAQTKVERTLVYSFSVGVSNDTTDTSMSNQMSSNGADMQGTNEYTDETSDQGTITVGVLGIEPDGGLVTNVSENARRNRTLAPVPCVVYPNSNIVCGTNGRVSPEERSVLRTLNPKFFDPSALDSKGQWTIDPAPGVSLTFTAGKPDNGIIPINGTRDEHTIDSSLHSEATYAYDMAKFMPTSIKEYETIRQQKGPGGYATFTVDVTASLTSDSTAQKS